MNEQHHDVQVLVVGAGPAGIAAACAAAEASQKVAVVDNSPWLGGQIWRGEQAHASQSAAQRWMQRLKNSGAQVFSGATVFDANSRNSLLVETPASVLEFTWQKLVIATGARELFLPFPGWTLPGVLGPGGLHAMAKAGWPVVGNRVVVAGSGPLLLAAADGLKRHGAKVLLIAEQARWRNVLQFGGGLLRHPGKLIQGLAIKTRLLGVPYRCGWWPVRAEGEDALSRVVLTDGSRTWSEDCDCLACAFNLVPNLELPRLLDCAILDGFVQVNEYQETTVKDVFCAGELVGIGGVEAALEEGALAGLAASGRVDDARGLIAARASRHHFRKALREAFALRPELRQLADAGTVVCRCEDVRLEELKSSGSWKAAKLRTRCGMGACQGRVCGAAAQFLFGWENTSVRPPIFPARAESLAFDIRNLKTKNPK